MNYKVNLKEMNNLHMKYVMFNESFPHKNCKRPFSKKVKYKIKAETSKYYVTLYNVKLLKNQENILYTIGD